MAKVRALAAIAAIGAVAATGVTVLLAPAVVSSAEPSPSAAVVQDDREPSDGPGDRRSSLPVSARPYEISDGTGPSRDTETTASTVLAPSTAPSPPEPTAPPRSSGAVGDPSTPILPAAEAPAVIGTSARFAWFYKPPANASATELAARFDVVVLTRNDEGFRDQLKAADPSLQVLQYVLANEIQDAGSGQPWRNQAAWNPGDAAALLARHPDWFARDEAGRPLTKRIDGGRTIYTMDPSRRDWTDYLVNRVLAHNVGAGWDGVFLDNVEMSLGKRRREGPIPAAHPTDAAWQDAMVGHVAAIHRAFAAAGRPVWANVIEGGDSIAEIERLAPHLEGTMDESFGTGWDGRPRTGSSWQRDLAAVEARAARGDHSLLVAQGARSDRAALRYAYASYLLVAGPTVSFRYADHTTAYAEVWWSDEFDRALGEPLGARYRTVTGWARDFEGGRVTVDPVAGTAAVG